MATKKTTAVAATAAKKSILELVKSAEKNNGLTHVDLKPRTGADFLRTGSLSLNLIMGGGFFGGRVLQLFGFAGSGKSTLGYTTVAELRKLGVLTLFSDHEGTTERDYIKKLGVNLDLTDDPLLRYTRPLNGVETYSMWLEVLQGLEDQEGGIPQCCFMVDSIATMPTPGEMENWRKAKRLAQRAAMHSEWLGRLKTLISRKNVAVIAINQLRANPSPYAAPEARPGGNAWEFNTDSLIRVARGKQVEVQGDVFQELKFKTLKNKNYKAGQEIELSLHLGEGIDPAIDVLSFLKACGLWHKEKKGGFIAGLGKVDRAFGGMNEMENLLRSQGRDGPIFAACTDLLVSGEAIKLWEATKKTKVASTEVEVDIHAPTGDDSEAAYEARVASEDEAPAASAEDDDEEIVKPISIGKKKKKA
jgi:recombination protein RecA